MTHCWFARSIDPLERAFAFFPTGSPQSFYVLAGMIRFKMKCKCWLIFECNTTHNFIIQWHIRCGSDRPIYTGNGSGDYYLPSAWQALEV